MNYAETGPITPENPPISALEREAREAGVIPNLATALVAEGHLNPDGTPTHRAAGLMTVPLALGQRFWRGAETLSLPYWFTPGSADGAERIERKMKAVYWKRRRRDAYKMLISGPYDKACVMLRRGWKATLPFWYVAGLTMAVTLGTVLANVLIGWVRA